MGPLSLLCAVHVVEHGHHHLQVTTYQHGPLSLVEECRGLALIGRELHSVATPALLCHKEPSLLLGGPLGGVIYLLLTVSLWHKDRWLPCMERSYYGAPLCHKEPAWGKKYPRWWYFVPKPLVGKCPHTTCPHTTYSLLSSQLTQERQRNTKVATRTLSVMWS